MQAVKREHTGPELSVRKMLHALGLRFRLHRRDLPGSPDIVLARHKTVIFVHGCFWHHHSRCRYATIPKSRSDYWLPKFAANQERDSRKEKELKKQGWRVLTIWECQIKNKEALKQYLKQKFELSQSA